MAEAENNAVHTLETGRPTEHRTATTHPSPAPAHTDDAALARIMQRYDQLGAEPPRFTIGHNDDTYRQHGAHTVQRHGPDVPLHRDPGTRTVEGRIYGDDPWRGPENWSYRWANPSAMNRAINEYVRQNWETIRSDLAVRGRHSGGFDARHRIGEGFYNTGMFGAGPRQSQYATTSLVAVRISLVPDADPPQPFVVSAFPAGIL